MYGHVPQHQVPHAAGVAGPPPGFFPPGPSRPPVAPGAVGARIHAGVALLVILVLGGLGSIVAFFVGALSGDACGFPDSPPICTSGWGTAAVMFLPALTTMLAAAVALGGLVHACHRPSHVATLVAWGIWSGGGVLWFVLTAVLTAR